MINDLRFVSKEVFNWVSVNPDAETRKPSNSIQYLRERGKNSSSICARSMMIEDWDAVNLGTLDPETLLILKETGEAEKDIMDELTFGNAVDGINQEQDADDLPEPSSSDYELPLNNESFQTITGIRKRINALGWSKKLSKGIGKIERETRAKKLNKSVKLKKVSKSSL